MKKVKNWHPYDIGDMSYYLFHSNNVPFGFLEPCWQAASNNYTFKFCFLPRLQNWGTCVRGGQLVHKTQQNWQESQTLVIFFYPKIDEFCMTLWCYIGWASLSIHFFLISTLFCTLLFSQHSYRCLLFTWEFLLSIKYGILVQSSKNL